MAAALRGPFPPIPLSEQSRRPNFDGGTGTDVQLNPDKRQSLVVSRGGMVALPWRRPRRRSSLVLINVFQH